MRISSRVAAWLCIGALGVGAQARAGDEGWERASTATENLEEPWGDGVTSESFTLGNVERRQVFENVFEYSYRVRVGLGPYDVITLHRVVREAGPWSPMRTAKSVFLVHGDALGFRGAFLSSAASQAVSPGQSMAVFLAQQGVDVWGIDLRWVHVPSGTTDFSFMKDWNLGLHARDVGTGLALARGVRTLTGNGAGRMVLLGWSRGATVSYAYLNAETQLPQAKRHVSGFIPVDMAYSFAPTATKERQAACQTHAEFVERQALGQYEGGQLGLLLKGLGSLAIDKPTAPSDFLTGATNREVGLLFGAATYFFQKPVVIIDDYHWAGGAFSEAGLPTGLAWTNERFFFDTLTQTSPYQSIGEQVDTLAMWCGAPNVPYDDHLGQVKVPVLYVGAAGGTGGHGVHSLSLLGSTDVSTHLVPGYGHADLFLANGAQSAVWARILDWVQHH
ncbi:hypothetical protein ACN28E_08470 [Archangium lansingense]|uniref:hypothetical protein n=1 Tax=Archangium lansingense TaxID=2995310 RepID=UPI003B82C475